MDEVEDGEEGADVGELQTDEVGRDELDAGQPSGGKSGWARQAGQTRLLGAAKAGRGTAEGRARLDAARGDKAAKRRRRASAPAVPRSSSDVSV